MTFFDSLYFSIFNHYKKRLKQKANRLAVFYITFFQASIILVLGTFIAAFSSQMYVNTMSSTNAWILFTISILFIYLKNWVQYSGKKRNVLKAKMNKKNTYSIWLLWLLPFGCIFLSFILLNGL